jgi:hypothetical protein
MALLVLVPAGAGAAPETPSFGPLIEDYAEYVGQRRCRPKPKPGVVAFQQLLEQAYPDSTTSAAAAGTAAGASTRRAGPWTGPAAPRSPPNEPR